MSASVAYSESGGSKDNNKNTAQWSHDEENILAVWCLIDNPKIWPQLISDEKVILSNPRLLSLMKKPRNEILNLPDSMNVSRQFYCNSCNEIPFPWKGDADLKMIEDKPYPKGAFLCENGHTVCRACFQSCYLCTSARADLIRLNEGLENGLPSLLEILEPVSGSIGGWGQLNLCLAPIIPTKCFFLTEMIAASEFACQYFYNWCDFRGRGKDLRDHESKCSFGKSTLQLDERHSMDDIKTETQLASKDDDAKILEFKLDSAVMQTSDFLRKHIPNWDSINPRNKVRRKRHVSNRS